MLVQPKELTLEQRLTKAIFMIVNHPRYQWQAGVIAIGEKVVTEADSLDEMERMVTTAMTNGRDEWYSRDFCNDMTDAELRYMVLHENAHKFMRDMSCYEHLFRKDAQLAGMAADYVNNLMLNDENASDGFAVMPKYKDGPRKGKDMGLVSEEFRNMNLEEVFWKLQQEQDDEGGEGEGSGEGNGDGRDGGKILDDHDWEGYKDLDDEEKRQVDRDVEEAIRAGNTLAGKTGVGNSSVQLQELLQTDIDYLAAMRDFLTATCSGNEYSTWAAPHRKYLSAGYYLPSGISERAESIVFAPDVSGSCFTTKDLQKFFTHIVAIIKTLKVENTSVMFWDTEVRTPIETYTIDQVDQIVNLTKPTGGGGTTPECIPEYLREHNIQPQAVVVLTDGDIYSGSWGNWDCPVLWVVPQSRRKVVAPVGKTIVCDLGN